MYHFALATDFDKKRHVMISEAISSEVKSIKTTAGFKDSLTQGKPLYHFTSRDVISLHMT